jgi:PiT family inorganic phosphate transporter
VSAGAVGFARGLNDTPKILGLVLGAGAASSISAALLVTAAMAVGGIVAARRVTETLAIRITPMTTDQGFAANLATSLIVIGARRGASSGSVSPRESCAGRRRRASSARGS